MDITEALRDYIYAKMPSSQYEEAMTLFGDEERLLLYICYAYNTCEVLYNRGTMNLITNPDAIFISKVEMREFLQEFVDLVEAAMDEEKEYGTNENNRAN